MPYLYIRTCCRLIQYAKNKIQRNLPPKKILGRYNKYTVTRTWQFSSISSIKKKKESTSLPFVCDLLLANGTLTILTQVLVQWSFPACCSQNPMTILQISLGWETTYREALVISAIPGKAIINQLATADSPVDSPRIKPTCNQPSLGQIRKLCK